MLKRILKITLILVLLFIAMLYWSVSSTDETFGQSRLYQPKYSDSLSFKTYDSVLVAASTIYKADIIKRFMQGEQYRDAWATPVAIPVLYLDTLYGGVGIMKVGGGTQTHSLKLKDSAGIDYALRSVNKDPQPLIPDIARKLKVENIIVDGISAQHPYGAILVARLAEAAQIIHTKPKVVFLPKQKSLEDFNAEFGNRMFLLEYETESDVNWTDLPDVSKLIDTDDLQELKQEQGHRLHIDKRNLIRARLFDLLIGDWDRHAKQFGWAIHPRDGNLTAIPIPGDRDNAFFKNGGVVPRLLSHKYMVPRLRPFEEDIDFMEGLVYPFDRYFLLNTDLELFTSEAKMLQSLMTDEIIDNAFKVWPTQISALNKSEIAHKIKSRRNNLVVYSEVFKTEIDRQGLLISPLKGSEDKNFSAGLMECFECGEKK